MSMADMKCLLCGGTALGGRSSTAELDLRCPACGTYTITVGAVTALRQNSAKGALARAELERHHACGDMSPRVDMDFLDAATKPGA
jgi:hypothetical protein